MTTPKWTIHTGEQHDFCYPAARFNVNGCLLVWGGDDALRSIILGTPRSKGVTQHKAFAL
jgi:hypothetical protein